MAALAWLVAAVAVAMFLNGERRAALARASATGEALTLAVDAHTARTYEAVSITLADIADQLRQAPELTRNDAAFRDALQERLQALQPYVRAIFIVDAHGRLAHDTWFPHSPDVVLADRVYFRAHAADPPLERGIWPPVKSRQPGLSWFLAVTQRISSNGQFRGVAVASLEPHYFGALFSRLGLDAADSVTLYHRDGTLIASYPHREEDIGRSSAAFAVFSEHLQQAAAGSYITSAGRFAYERLVSYRELEGMPLVVTMRQSTWRILQPWRNAVLGAALGLGALALLLAMLIRQFLRLRRVRDLARERALQSDKLEASGRFTDAIGHDFANLLNVVAASLRVIGHEPSNATRVREAAQVGCRALAGGAALVEQLRRVAQRQPLRVQPSDLHAFLGAGLQLLRQASGEGVALRVELEARDARCLLDENELEVALVNLLVNARDAGARIVVLRTYDSGPLVCLELRDDGRGMIPQVRRRVFEPYFSTKGEKGTGLGLAQVYGFMRQVGGEASIESQPGKGTTICLMFRKAGALTPAASSPAQIVRS